MFAVIVAATRSEALVDVARAYTPRIEIVDPDRELVLDISGLTRLFGEPRAIAEHLRRDAADRGLRVRVAIAGTRTAARLLVRHRAGITVIAPGTEAQSLAPLPIDLLEGSLLEGDCPPVGSPVLPTGGLSPSRRGVVVGTVAGTVPFRRWGLRTLGELAALPADALAARLGQDGVRWQRLARGEDPAPLVPSVPEERFEQALDLEWPIEGLEPLSFVLGRLLDPLSAHLERRGRAAAVLHLHLHLVTREVHARSLQLPAPMRDARTLRTLLLLDLESHPPGAAIDRVVVAVDPTPGRSLQYSLLTRPLPSPEQVSTLMARLQALMGDTRCGAPATVDAWEPGAFAMRPFSGHEGGATKDTKDTKRGHGAHGGFRHGEHGGHGDPDSFLTPLHSLLSAGPVTALRRFRHPIAARVRVEAGRPVLVTTDGAGIVGGSVETCAGPWRTSGGWWQTSSREDARHHWDRDEWDVTLADGATYRLFHERRHNRWGIDAIVD